jgi:sterol desaturase/sphingolipid hydroxylase (fatty acid hydroxylase superfamily)
MMRVAGVRIRIPLLYDTADHDAHHAYYNVNYAFPFPLMDRLHGTHRPR